jgi:hypothetical protein
MRFVSCISTARAASGIVVGLLRSLVVDKGFGWNAIDYCTPGYSTILKNLRLVVRGGQAVAYMLQYQHGAGAAIAWLVRSGRPKWPCNSELLNGRNQIPYYQTI